MEFDHHQNTEVHSNTEDRYLLIKDLLSTHLGLDCLTFESEPEPKHTPAYLLGTESVSCVVHLVYHILYLMINL